MDNNLLIIAGVVVLLVGLFAALNPLEGVIATNTTNGKVAYVDLQAIFNAHPDKLSAEAELNEKARNYQQQLEEDADELARDEQQQLIEEFQKELSNREEQLIQLVLDDIDQAIDQVAAQKELKVVMDKKNVLYGGYDLTQDVIDYILDNK